MMFTAPSSGGFTLPQLLLTLSVMAVLLAISLPAYQNHVRKSKLQQARSALMENAQFMERFYQQHKTFKQTSTTWPALPLTATADFCIRPQGLARGALDGKFTLKAVAFDKNREPRTLKINESLNTFICETTTSTCEDEHTYFRGDNRVDKTCTVFR